MVPRVRQLAKTVPGVQLLRRWRYERHFAGREAAYRGVFTSFGEACASAPPGRPLGFDRDALVEKFADRVSRVFPYDYPMLFWLRPLLVPGCVVFDWGGNLGVHYHAYSKYLTFPAGMRWIVCEVPRIVAAGNERLRTRPDDALHYTTDLAAIDGANVLLAAGSIQYIEAPTLAPLLASLASPPSDLLLNKLPLYDGNSFVTLQNAGAAFVPLHVWNRQSFVNDLHAIGYELIDTWDVPERPLYLPTYPDRSLEHFTGLYLRRRR